LCRVHAGLLTCPFWPYTACAVHAMHCGHHTETG
jgi:hypothetical protein